MNTSIHAENNKITPGIQNDRLVDQITKIRNLKIETQLKLGFGVILFLIMILGTISWYQNDLIGKEAAIMYNHPLQVRRALGELKADILVIHRGMKDLLLAESEQETSSLIIEMNISKDNAFEQFDIIKEKYLGPQADIEKAYNSFIKYNTIREETIRILQAGDKNSAHKRIKATGEGGAQVTILLADLKIIEVFAKEKGDQLYRNTVNLNNSLKSQLLTIIFCIIAVFFTIIVIILKNIREPLTEILDASVRFKNGEKNARSSYSSANEFGLLSKSFNEMAETVGNNLTVSEGSAKISAIMLSENDGHLYCISLLNALLECTDAQMGAVYFLNEDKTAFEKFECIGLDADQCRPFSAVYFEGEFGRALAGKKLQHISEIPEDTPFTLSTVGGSFKAREILTIPAVSGTETIAVISLATIKNFNEISLELIESLMGILSARMDGIIKNVKAVEFSHKLEQQNIELNLQKKELTEQNIELDLQKKQMDEANRLKTSFLSNMSHELRTPLNSVIALSSVLHNRLKDKIPDEEYSFLDVIERNGNHLLDLINDILDISRIEAGREEIEISTFTIKNLITEIAEMIRPQAAEKNISIDYTLNDSFPEVQSDMEKCRHILQNIVSNAIKFTEKGGVAIKTDMQGDMIRIQVSDTGIGIEKKFMPYIFDEFRQADDSTFRKKGGTGLGLAIAKKYADLLNCSLTAESELGEGSVFTFTLPLHFNSGTIIETGSNILHQPDVKRRFQDGNLDARDKTILLVEDTEAIIIQMKDMLETCGYNILTAHNGKEALDQISKKIPDAMILDLMMPEVDGFEVLKSIRSDKRTEALPVIILTAKYISKEELAFLKHNHVHQLIQKGGVNREQLLNAVAEMIFPEKIQPILELIKTGKKIEGKPRVLVVEDHADNMITIKALIGGRFEIIEALDGLAGVEMARKHIPDLILMDIALPAMNGIDALALIRKDKTLKDIPVIAVSASAMKNDRESLLSHGFDYYISKPIDKNLFDQIINGIFI